MFGKNNRAATFPKRLKISIQNCLAPFLQFDGQFFGVNDDLHAGGQTHEVVCVSHGVRLIEVVDTPTEPTLSISPRPETIDMQITDRKNFGRTAKVSTD
jgi:hypothetical protein